MGRSMNAARWLCGSMVLAFTASALPLDFAITSIPLQTDTEFAIRPYFNGSPTGADLLVVAYDDDEGARDPSREIQLYSTKPRAGGDRTPYVTYRLDTEMQLVDVISLGGMSRLVGYQDQKLKVFDPTKRTFEDFLTIPSIFRGLNTGDSPLVEIFKDLNGDERDDVMMADFRGWQVATQSADGVFSPPRSVGPAPFMAIGSERFAMFRAEEPYVFDHDLDGRQDLGFWIDGALSVHHQLASGEFAAEPVVFETGHHGVMEGYYSLSIGEDPDSPDGTQRIIGGVDDVNGDGYPDLILQAITGAGVFGKETRFEFYFGYADAAGRLAFPASPSSVIASDGIQMLSDRRDLNGDGTKEMVITSIDIGIGTIIRALLTRSFSLDVGIYGLRDGAYPNAPSVKRSITARFDLGEGELYIPALLPADVTGDGKLDLLLQDGNEQLRIYPGIDGPALFASKPVRIELPLPRNRTDYLAVDLNEDGRDELVLQHRDDDKRVSIVKFY